MFCLQHRCEGMTHSKVLPNTLLQGNTGILFVALIVAFENEDLFWRLNKRGGLINICPIFYHSSSSSSLLLNSILLYFYGLSWLIFFLLKKKKILLLKGFCYILKWVNWTITMFANRKGHFEAAILTVFVHFGLQVGLDSNFLGLYPSFFFYSLDITGVFIRPGKHASSIY